MRLKLFAIAFLSMLAITTKAQPAPASKPAHDQKPYKLITKGKQVSIKSIKGIKQVMLWTSGGNRVVEQKDINNSSYIMHIPVSQKTFFLMIGLTDGTVYTEKLAIP